MSVVTLRGVSRRFGAQDVLRDLDLTIEPGEARASALPPPAPATAASPAPPAVTAYTTEPATASRAEVSEVAKKAEQGIIPFLIFSAVGGLWALVMPCVWPRHWAGMYGRPTAVLPSSAAIPSKKSTVRSAWVEVSVST